jgi:hypothetical protein
LFEKCCPKFLAGGDQTSFRSVRLKDGNWSCPGGCNKVHPTITLFFDSEKSRTVAILSFRLNPFTTYFERRMKEGSAISKSPFYYELDGYVRENLHQLREKNDLFGDHLVKAALGALKESDDAQRAVLEQAHRTRKHATRSFEMLEEVLQICRLHRLSEDLDVFSIHCMQKTNKMFRRIANPIAEQRMRDCQFVVKPLVDGHFISGYSVFRRARGNGTPRHTVIEREQGRMVEYAVCPSIVCHEDSPGRYLPCKEQQIGDVTASSEFSWGCEELSFANLEREWGDIGVNEYIGQKILVQWRRNSVDIPGDGRFSTTCADLPVFDLRLTYTAQKPEILQFSAPLFRLKLDLKRMNAIQVDEVTVSFQGNARILECNTNFMFLVSAYARSFRHALEEKHEQILKTRPLLRHELSFLKEVQMAESLYLYSCSGR